MYILTVDKFEQHLNLATKFDMTNGSKLSSKLKKEKLKQKNAPLLQLGLKWNIYGFIYSSLVRDMLKDL